MEGLVIDCISGLLEFHETVIIPEFGAFVTKHKPASINGIDGIISPPSKVITFDHSIQINDGLLFDAYSNRKDITYLEAKAEVQHEVEKLKSALKKKEIINFGEIGRLCLDFESKVKFYQSDKNFNLLVFGLKPIAARPIERRFTKAAEAKVVPLSRKENVSQTKKKKSFWQNIMPFLVTGVIGIFAALFLINKGNTIEHEDPLKITVHQQNLNKKPSGLKDVAKIESLELKEQKEVYNKKDLIQADKDEAENKEQIEEPIQIDDCVIIIGLFGNPENVNKLSRRLTSKGYDPVFKTIKNLTRVGVRAPCQGQTLEDQLVSIQNDFEPKAWVLR